MTSIEPFKRRNKPALDKRLRVISIYSTKELKEQKAILKLKQSCFHSYAALSNVF